MSDISELQARIAGALDRIGSGLEGLGKLEDLAADYNAEISRLNAQLDEERTASAQLEERVRSIKDTQDGTVDRLNGEVERLTRLLTAQENASARMARANEELRANNAALRAAITKGVAEPHLINKAMMAELDALRMAQGADRAELDAVLSELDTMIEAAQAGEGEDA